MNTSAQIAWPEKQREMVEWVIDSHPWNSLKFRDDDVAVCTWGKSGTTLMQQILGQLILDAAPDVYGPDHSPWIDSRFTPDAVERAEAQSHRRFLKSHLPIESIVYSPRAKYVYVGRDIRDVFWSWHNHQANFTPEILGFIQSLPGQQPGRASYPNADPQLAFREWLERDGYPWWPFWSHVQGWFDARHLPNLSLFHFAEMKADLPEQVRRLAAFLEIEIPPRQVGCDPPALQLRSYEDPCPAERHLAQHLQAGGRHPHPQGFQWPLARRAHSGGYRGL